MTDNPQPNSSHENRFDVESTSSAQKDAAERSAPDFHLGRVLLIVVPLGLILVAGAGFYAYGGAEWLADVTAPPLAPVEGRVFYQGQPLAGAVVRTKPSRAGLMGGIGIADANGRFSLKTDVKGTYQEGAYVGEHKVIVGSYGASTGTPAPPPLLTPDKYASLETTPFVIEVAKPPLSNVIRLELERNAPSEAGSPPTPSPSGKSDAGAAPSGDRSAGEDQASSAEKPMQISYSSRFCFFRRIS